LIDVGLQHVLCARAACFNPQRTRHFPTFPAHFVHNPVTYERTSHLGAEFT